MARKKKQGPKLKQWTVPVRLVLEGTVLVEAVDADDAIARARAGKFVRNSFEELVDWDVRGEAKEDR